MIQRIQSVFLALVVVLCTVLFFVPMYVVPLTAVPVKADPGWIAKSSYNLLDLPLLIGPVVLTAFIAVMALFSYKNRTRQMKMARAGMLVSVLLSATAIGFPQFYLHGIDRSLFDFGIGAWLLIANIPLFGLAFFFIRKDENLVRSADRLR